MKRANTKKSNDQYLEIVEFMTEFARFLIAAGVSRTRFARIVEFAYLQAASRDARFQNSRLNQSAIAAMTGLTRSQVRAMLKQERNKPKVTDDRVDRIIGAWTADAEYITAAFAPRRLRIVGPSPSFSTLVSKVGGDIPSRSILRELERQRLVTVDGRYVILAHSVQSGTESRSLRQLSSALARVIHTTAELGKAAVPIRAVTMEVNYPVQSSAGRILMQRRLSNILKSLMADVEAAGASVAIEAPSRSKRDRNRVSRARLLLLTHEENL